MARPAPVISTGMKASRGARAEAANTKREVGAGIYARISALLKGKTPEPKAPATPYEVVFQSRYRSHRVQIDAPADVIDARGRKTQGRTLFAQFRQYHFSIPKFIKLPQAEDMLAILRAHPAANKDFWEEKDNSHEIRVAQVARVVDLLEKDPDVKSTILDYLTEQDFVESQIGAGDAPTVDELAGAEEVEEPVRKATRRPTPKPKSRVRANV